MSDERTQQLAIEAARLVIDGGLEYGAAKAKAARQLGVRRGPLPSNEEIEDQVREHLALFCADTQPAELAALRAVALQWMQRLEEFLPHLGGAVWRGTATRHNAVFLDLYCDDPKAVPISLVNAGIDYDDQARPGSDGQERPVFSVASPSAALGEHVTVHLVVHDRDDQRGALKPDSRGRSWRGDRKALQRLIEEARPT